MLKRALHNTLNRLDSIRRLLGTARAIDALNVADCSNDEPPPFVRLERGPVFFGYPPPRILRLVFRYLLRPSTRKRLTEGAVGVAADVVLRYQIAGRPVKQLAEGKYYDFRSGQRVVEVGAFLGLYAMRVSELVGPSGHVIAIEAVDENLELLRRNVQANAIENITVVGKAAWCETGLIGFERQSRQKGSILREVVRGRQLLEVSADTVDNILTEVGVTEVDFVRVQVNGAEPEVLQGMKRTLESRPTLLIAVPYLARRNMADTIGPILRQLGYNVSLYGNSLLARV